MSAHYFIFDKNKCVGCQACVVACMNENGFQAHQQWRNIFTSNDSKVPGIPLFHISLSCNHCDDAPCMKHCPALAYTKSIFTGAVLIQPDHCIGCQYCLWNCPYEAPKFNPFEGVVEKCNFCDSRLQKNKAPACTLLCPTGALDFSFEDIDKSQISASIAVAVNPNPSIKITELAEAQGPEMDRSLFATEDLVLNEKPIHKIGTKAEWPLLIFTFIIAVMVALSAAGVHQQTSEGLKWGMILAGGIGAILSSVHLGKKFRWWRSLLNLRHSWLSREIFFFGLYYLSVLTDFFILDLNYYIMLIPGALTLFSIDMLYSPVQRKWKIPFHSGQSIFITISILLLLHQFYGLLLIFLLSRFGLHIYNFISFDQSLFKYPLFLFRWSLIDLSIILYLVGTPTWTLLLCIGLGELLDRVLFYEDLKIETLS